MANHEQHAQDLKEWLRQEYVRTEEYFQDMESCSKELFQDPYHIYSLFKDEEMFRRDYLAWSAMQNGGALPSPTATNN